MLDNSFDLYYIMSTPHYVTIGLVNDMYAENSDDDYKGYKEVATQEDFDKF